MNERERGMKKQWSNPLFSSLYSETTDWGNMERKSERERERLNDQEMLSFGAVLFVVRLVKYSEQSTFFISLFSKPN